LQFRNSSTPIRLAVPPAEARLQHTPCGHLKEHRLLALAGRLERRHLLQDLPRFSRCTCTVTFHALVAAHALSLCMLQSLRMHVSLQPSVLPAMGLRQEITVPAVASTTRATDARRTAGQRAGTGSLRRARLGDTTFLSRSVSWAKRSRSTAICAEAAAVTGKSSGTGPPQHLKGCFASGPARPAPGPRCSGTCSDRSAHVARAAFREPAWSRACPECSWTSPHELMQDGIGSFLSCSARVGCRAWSRFSWSVFSCSRSTAVCTSE
jgi:hypothetical protein